MLQPSTRCRRGEISQSEGLMRWSGFGGVLPNSPCPKGISHALRWVMPQLSPRCWC